MNSQLRLLAQQLDDDHASRRRAWQLDETTRRVGRDGVAQARAALQAAVQHRHLDEDHASAA